MVLGLGAAGVGSVWGRGVAGGCGLLLAAALLVAVPFERGDAAAASPVSTAGGVVSPAAALTFTNRTTANGLGSNNVQAVYATDDTIYAGTLNLGGGAPGGLSISTNGGASFTNLLSGNSVSSVFVTDAIVDTIYASTYGSGLFISTDGGASFTNRTVASGGLADDDVYDVYATDDTVYAATSMGLSISTDGGANFTTTWRPPTSFRVFSVYAVGSNVYAGTDGDGLAVSSDGGANFTLRTIANTAGLGSDIVRGVYATGTTVYTIFDTMLGGTGGISISNDSGSTFTQYRSGLGSDSGYAVYESSGVIYASTRDGLSISNNGGVTFTNDNTTIGFGPDQLNVTFARSGIVYAGTNSGLNISGSSLPGLDASPAASSVEVGATGTVTISSAALAIPDGTSVSAVSDTPGVATVTSSVNASGGTAAFTVTGVSAGTSNVTFSAAGYANVVVPVTVTAPGPGPGPAPVFPPSAPSLVTGVAGDGSAVVSWAEPSSAGSFPVSTYQAVVSPGGQSCLVSVPALTCAISGLTNGTAYTATVRALNGSGWGEWSAPSAEVTPAAPSIMITGSRAEVRGKPRVVVTGTTTGFGMGAILRPWIRFPGQTSPTQGTASILVDDQGGFTWERRTGKTIYISIRSEDATVESNRLILRRT